MPVIEENSFHPAPYLQAPHVQTIFPALFRKAIPINYVRERLQLSDGDFLDLDWNLSGSDKIVVLLHGLESNSGANYITRMVYLLHRMGLDSVAVNFRGCSGTPNRMFKAYHSGKTDDLQEVIHHALSKKPYSQMYLVGFSLGGNILLKYMGEYAQAMPDELVAAAAVSVPCDLASSSKKLQQPDNSIYSRRFLQSLKRKVLGKKEQFPSWFNVNLKDKIRTIEDFDDWYTAPAHGFEHAQDYYKKNGSIRFLPLIQRPTLLLNALDDPFLTMDCMPFDLAKTNDQLFFSYTHQGGHVGFHSKRLFGLIHWHEKKVISFLLKQVPLGSF
ncbi:MAG: alpha/beta fold hydrolase [Cytophagales bacterium]|nr:alpha/beta fold hydrolase [Cytophagales bacterium]